MYRILSVAIFAAAVAGSVAQANTLQPEAALNGLSNAFSQFDLNSTAQRAAPTVLAGYHSPLKAPEQPGAPVPASPEQKLTPDGSYKVAPYHSPHHAPGQPSTSEPNSAQQQTTPDGSYKVAPYHAPHHAPGQPDASERA